MTQAEREQIAKSELWQDLQEVLEKHDMIQFGNFAAGYYKQFEDGKEHAVILTLSTPRKRKEEFDIFEEREAWLDYMREKEEKTKAREKKKEKEEAERLEKRKQRKLPM